MKTKRDTVSVRIMQIRNAALARLGQPEHTLCPLCREPAAAPFRKTSGIGFGPIIVGCVDAFHTGHLVPGTASYEWHNRDIAKNLRASMLASLEGK